MTTELSTIDAPDELRESVAACITWSESNEIATAEDYQFTGEHLKQIKSQQKEADAFFDPPIKQAFDLHRMLVGRKKLVTEPLSQSEAIDKRKMLAYSQEQQRKADEERRKLQAAADEKARKERERAEQEAERQRQIEAENRRKAEESRLAAEQATEAERKRLLDEAEAAERRANAAAVKVEAKQEIAATAVAPVVAVATAAPKIAGVSTKKVWKFRVVNASLVPDDFKLIDEKKLGAYAKAMKEGAKVAGVEFYADDSLSASGK